MSTLFCCGNANPYRPQTLQHEAKFLKFLAWAKFPKSASKNTEDDGTTAVDLIKLNVPFVMQLVRQVNYGPLESKRYFASVEGQDEEFIEVDENDLIQANFQKLNSWVLAMPHLSWHPRLMMGHGSNIRYKNFRCRGHNKFFEVNIYEQNPVNKHHWRVNAARPGADIDL
jgi:hypothetical protein